MTKKRKIQIREGTEKGAEKPGPKTPEPQCAPPPSQKPKSNLVHQSNEKERIIRIDNCGNCPYYFTTEIPFDGAEFGEPGMAVYIKDKYRLEMWCRLVRKTIGQKTCPKGTHISQQEIPDWCLLDRV